MSTESAQRAPMMNLKEVVERYAALTSVFGEPVALAGFRLGKQETENLFSSFDEDYHISRFLHFTRAEGPTYSISGEMVTHVAIDSAIQSLL